MEIVNHKIKFLEEYQELITPNVEKWRYLVYYGGRASGKSQHVALSLLMRGREKKIRILCTREIQKTIKDSVHKLLSDIIEKHDLSDYTITNDSIRNSNGTEFIFRGLRQNINEIKSTEGIDVCWVEEAQSVSNQSLDVLTPTIRKPGSQIIFTFNRFTELDPVFVKFVMGRPQGCYVAKVNYDALERVDLLPDVIKMEIEADKANPAIYAHKWLGEPLQQDDFAVIPRERIMEAMQRSIVPEGSIEVGVDVARMGDDRIVFWMVHGLKTLKYQTYNKKKIPETCDLLEQFIEYEKGYELKIDDTGVGGGVTDEMQRRGYRVRPINFGSKAMEEQKYQNLISEAWFYLLENIDEIQLPMDQDLLMELSTRKWKQDNKGRNCIESKAEYKKRGYRSPDLADACILAYYRKALRKVSIDFI